MSREIKFRVWDKVLDEMALPCQWEEDFVGGGNKKIGLYIYRSSSDPRGHSSLSWVLHHPESFILMQYTGLKDKDGVEIYEGDICNIHIFIQELGENMGVMEGEREFVAEICFDCICGLSAKNSKGDSGPLYMYNGFEDSEEQIEVIGNIHQHRELLGI